MRAEGTVGPQLLSDGDYSDLRLGRSGELVTSGFHGKYYEQTYRGNVFVARNLGGFFAPAGTAAGPLGLYNPPGSGKNLVLLKTIALFTSFTTSMTAGALAYFYSTNASISTPNLSNAVNCLLGSGNISVAQVFISGVISPTPAILFPIVSKTGTAVPASNNSQIIDDVNGAIILSPGAILVVQETTLDTNTGNLSYVWEEVPI